MKVNRWTLGLAALGLVTLSAEALAEEKLSPVDSAVSSIVLSGYVDTSMHWNPGTGNANPPRIAFNTPSKQDGFNLNALKIGLEKPMDENSWAAGYKAELLVGPNATALGTLLTSANDNVPMAIKQAYVLLRAPIKRGLDLKIGVFDNTVTGYESTDAVNNPNYTRSYGYSIEPTTFTGVLASYELTDSIALSAGVANSYGPVVGGTGFSTATTPSLDRAWTLKAESYKTYMGSVTFKAPESFGFLKGSMLFAGIINGFNGSIPSGAIGATTSGGADQTTWYVGATMPTPIKGLRLGASYDYANVSDQTLSGGFYKSAAAVYLSYQCPNDSKWSFHARGEYFSQSEALVDHLATFTPGGITFSPGDATHAVGLPSKVFAATATLQYDLWKNVLSRLEFRWDHSADGRYAYGGTSPNNLSGAGGGPAVYTADRRNNYIVAANFIYRF